MQCRPHKNLSESYQRQSSRRWWTTRLPVETRYQTLCFAVIYDWWQSTTGTLVPQIWFQAIFVTIFRYTWVQGMLDLLKLLGAFSNSAMGKSILFFPPGIHQESQCRIIILHGSVPNSLRYSPWLWYFKQNFQNQGSMLLVCMEQSRLPIDLPAPLQSRKISIPQNTALPFYFAVPLRSTDYEFPATGIRFCVSSN